MLRDEILPKLRDYFARHGEGVVAAYLFGSVARGQETAASDVDLGVVFGTHRRPTLELLDRMAAMQIELSDLLGRQVDLIAFDGAPPDLLHHALGDRVLLFDGDHDARIEFEIRARNEYFDLQPLLELYRRTVLRRA